MLNEYLKSSLHKMQAFFSISVRIIIITEGMLEYAMAPSHKNFGQISRIKIAVIAYTSRNAK